MKNLKILFTSCVIILSITGCSKDDKNDDVVLPSDLQIETTVNATGTGAVTVKATSKNNNFYYIYFGESSTETPVTSNDGNASHTYTKSGTYTIKVEAHITVAQFITQTKQVSVVVGNDPTGIPTTGYTTPESYDGLSLIWQDEFNGTTLNESDWTFETGAGGWGNNELEYYRKENTQVKDGYLTITAKKESFGGSNYTSSRIKTQNKKIFKYGRVDIRAALPKGQGIWPALWMLGNNIDSTPWPKCGEIDIMELIGGGTGRDNKVYGTPHWYDTDAVGHASYGGSYTLGNGTFNDAFHVFSIIWSATEITWYVDDVKFHTINTAPDDKPERLDEFRNDYFFVFNVAVGGDWPQYPNASTTFPQQMVVDYIRVFQ